MQKIILIGLLTFISSVLANDTGAGSGVTLNGENDDLFILYKECLQHNVMYESHPITNGLFTPCSYPLEDVPGYRPKTEIAHRHVPHDPECFSEIVVVR